MAVDLHQFSSLIVAVLSLVVLINLSLTVFALFKKRWRLLKLTESVESGGLKSPHFLYGNLHELPREEKDRVTDLIERMRRCDNTARMWFGPFECVITVINPEYVRLVLANADTKETVFHGFLRSWLGDGLLLSGGQKWIRHRRLLTPGFHFEILRPYVKLFVNSTNVFLDKLEATNGEYIDVFRPVSLMTLDSLLKCSFSYESHCQTNEENPYIKSVYALADLAIARLRFVPYHNDTVFKLSPMGRQYYSHCKLVHDKADATIRERRAQLERLADMDSGGSVAKKGKYLDFLDILIKAKDENGHGLGDLEIRHEADTFMFEGHDTTASAVSWCLYDLARHPKFQQKCQEEIDDLLETKGKEELDWDDMNRIPYITMCIKESLRVHPPVPGIARSLVKDVTLPDGLVLPKGTTVGVSPVSTQLHPLYWKDPDVFDPTRFTVENSRNRHSHAFFPFSAGPRNCIGQHFAMNEIKVAIALTLRRYHVSPDPERPPVWIFRLVSRTLDGLYLRFTPRVAKKL